MIPQLPISVTWLVLVLRVQHRGVQVQVFEHVGRVGRGRKGFEDFDRSGPSQIHRVILKAGNRNSGIWRFGLVCWED